MSGEGARIFGRIADDYEAGYRVGVGDPTAVPENPFRDRAGREAAMVECEFCGADDVTLYAWHADVWCGECIAATGGLLELTGKVAEAPLGRPENPTYSEPFVWQTPYGSVVAGVVQERTP